CAYPVPNIAPDAWQRLPEQRAMGNLIDAARGYYALHQNMHMVATPGTQALIQALPFLTPAAHVAIITPTYGEHAHVWRTCGHAVSEVRALDGVPGDCSVSVVVNPNNPDGRTYSAGELLTLANTMQTRGGFLVVDEAFCDVTPGLSLAAHDTPDGLIILKSFGKFFGLAGLRLGFAVGDPVLVNTLGQRLGPWAVSGPALSIGAVAYDDTSWIAETRNNLSRDRQRLETLLRDHGMVIPGATDLFVLAETATAMVTAAPLYAHLGAAGVLVRSYAAYPTWLRFGLPGTEQHWARLEHALHSFS
ncbi:MAG: aminotransferase class I/II-fold pyridoxal phosphate-dependent enzyme, partial [Rhodospirillales bacterium]|nr:aminotransferase class I/II-fold pyridoxal phosphate-dependent enzyme [Rhodospirillales bacterium]